MSRPAWIAVICILGIIKLVKCNQYPEFIGEKTLKQFFGIDDFNNHYGSSKNPSFQYTPHFVELENVESTLDRYPPKKGHPKDEIMNISIIVLKAFLQPARHTDNPVEKDDIPVATPSPSIASLVTYWKNDNNGWQYQQSDIEVPQHSIEAQPFFYYDRPLGSRRAMNGMDDSYADDDPTYAANYNPSFPDARKGGAIPGGGGGRGRGLPSYGEPPPDSEESEQPVLRSGPGGGGPPEGYGGPGGPPGYGRPRSLPEYGGPGGPPGYGRPPGYRGPGGPPGYGGPGGPPGYGYPGGPPGYRGPGGPPGYGGRGGPPGYGRPGVPPGYGVSGVPPGYGGNGGPPGYGGPDGPPGYGGLRGPPGYGGPGGPPGYGAGGQNPALGPRSQAYMGVGAPGGPSAHDLLRSGPEGLQYSINPDFPQMPSKAKAVPTGEQLVGITRHKLQLYSQIDEKNRQGNHSYLYTTKPPLDLRSQLLALPRVDDFGAPIKWVKFNSHETVDGLAKVTDPSNMKNQQHMVQGAIYVPVADHNALRMGPTSEEPTTQQSPVESTPYPNYEIVQTVLRSVDINRTTEMDWLAVEAITLNVKGTSVKGCSGEGCQARCRTMNCDSTCTGDSCGSGCIGVSCNAFCKGPGCVTMCIGEFCTTKCDGENCHARCRRYACQQSINGIYTETVPYWDRVEQAEYDADAAAGPGGPGAPGGPARPGGPYGVRSPGGPRQRAQAYDDYYA